MDKNNEVNEATEIIRHCIRESGMKIGDLADKVGVKQNTVSMSINRDMRYSTMKKYLEAMGYELIVRRKVDTTEW